MKKVAIMTWFHYQNFGTALQVAAMYYAINQLGYKVDVINYLPHENVVTLNGKKVLKDFLTNGINKFKSKLYRNFGDLERCEAFNKFISQHITLTKRCKTTSELFSLNKTYDSFVCGSDQIWAPSCFDPKYFLDFVQSKQKLISYAPSIGLASIKDEYVKKQMKQLISRFKHLSVRERHGRKLIGELCGKNAEVVLDPTLLLSAETWDKFASKKISINEPYLLCYFLGDNRKTWKHTKKLAKKLNLPIKVISINNKTYHRGMEVLEGIGPAEFIELINNAAFVCTDSFHGTIFSIQYEKPFYVYERFSKRDSNSQNSRIYNILEITRLKNRLVLDKNTVEENPTHCDFDIPKRILAEERMFSLQFLEKALQDSTVSHEEKEEWIITNTCIGCGACKTVCPENAIEVTLNKKGFFEANVKQYKCLQCGICRTVCPFNGGRGLELDPKEHKLYMLQTKQGEVLNHSSSGGAGYELAKYFSEKGYDVIGCLYDKTQTRAMHHRVLAGDIKGIESFQGSKYLQSDTRSIFEDVASNNQKAIFFGTPCQVAAMDRLLKSQHKREDYFLVDLICHGIPTQNLWKKYLQEIDQKYGTGPRPNVIFRFKSKGWRKMHMYISNSQVSYCQNEKKDLFYRFFKLGHCYADSCFECTFRTSSHADLRIGDYWGPKYVKDNNGVSMVIALTEAGVSTLERLDAKGIVKLQAADCQEYWDIQSPINPIKPVFYDELIKNIGDNDKSLSILEGRYCADFEILQAIYRIIAKSQSIKQRIFSIFKRK